MSRSGLAEQFDQACAGGGKQVLAFWNDVVPAATAEPGFLEEHAGELVALLFQALPLHRDLACQRAALRCLRQCLASEAVLKAAAAALVRAGGRRHPPQDAYVLLCWSTAVVRRLELPAAKKAIAKLAESQAGFLDAVLASRFKWQAAARVMQATWKQRPALLDEYLEVAKATGSPGLARAALQHAAAQPALLQQHRAFFLALFTERVLGAREPPPPASLAAFRPLAAALTEAELGEGLLPAVLRMAKRSPEAALTSAAFLFGEAPLDLSPHLAPLAQELLPLLRHAREGVRAAAAKLLQQAAAKSADAAAIAAALAAFQKVLDGSAGGKLRNASERSGLAAAIEALAAAKPAAAEGAATQAAEFLASAYKEEANEEVKLQLLAALGAWLRLAPSFPPAALARVEAGLREKDALRRAHLRCLNQALQENARLAAGGASLAGPLAKVALDGVSKPALRADAVAALLAAAALAAGNPGAGAALEQAGVWREVGGGESALLSPTTAAKLPAEEAADAARLAHLLVAQHRSKLQPSALGPLARLLALLALHHSSAVRRAALAQLAAADAAGPEWQAALAAALLHWLQARPPPGLLVEPATLAEGAGGGEAGPRLHAAASRLAGAVGAAPPTAVVGDLLLVAAHPSVAGAWASAPASWTPIRRRMGPAPVATEASTPAVLERLLGSDGAASPAPDAQAAAFGALECLMRDGSAAAGPSLFPRLEALLDPAEADSLSAAELTIFRTPEGQVALQVDVTAIGEDLGRPAARMPSGGAAAAPPAAAKLAAGARGRAAGGGKPAPKDSAAERQEKQLAQEAQVRQRVVSIQLRLERGLRALRAAVLGDRAWAAAHLDRLQGLLRPLLASPLVGEGPAFDAEAALCSALPGPLGRASLQLACSLRLVSQHAAGEAGLEPVPEHAATAAVVAAMAEATKGRRPLPPAALRLCLPVLAAVLRWPTHSGLHDPALAALGLHVGRELDVPRADMLQLLFHVLDTIPAFRGKVQTMLDSLCAGVASPADMRAAFEGLLQAESHVRGAAAAALPNIPSLARREAPAEPDLVAVLWLAQHDPDPAVAEAALDVWEDCGCSLPPAFVPELLRHLASPHADVRVAAAEALAFGLQEAPDARRQALDGLLQLYRGSPAWQGRSGAALALASCASAALPADVPPLLDFLMAEGVLDSDDTVRSQMVEAGMALVDAHGAAEAPRMLPLFEGALERTGVADEQQYDRVRQAAVVFLGTLARHMEPGSAKVKSIVGTLVDVLRTPSAEVQRAVSSCLPPLMPGLAADGAYVAGLVSRLLDMLLKSKSYGDRKGAAFGLAGVVTGLGIRAVNGHGILASLSGALEDKESNARQGALLAIECLVDSLGRLFEPYVWKILGKLLDRFGDVTATVRDANDAAAQAIMANLSSHGVRLALDALMGGVDSKAWRAKQGAVQMLGAMAHLAPGPLATALPRIVPKLSSTLSDPHPKVQAAARQALKEVGAVVRNPEIQKLSPALLAAIAEPDKHGSRALDAVLGTTFVNTVDAASLALLVPVIHRALRDRSGEAKKRAARIVGNMCALVNDPQDMAPYVPLLVPELQLSLIDPLPAVRATAARALGSLLRGMGEASFQGLLPWLLETMKSDGPSVERSGAAQGLAEVLAAQGRAYLDGLLPQLLASCSAKNPYVREGHLTLFKFLPGTLGDAFQEYLAQVLPAILDGLADESEGVRNAALAAGRTLVEAYAASSLPLLLPAVEAGIVNDNWRIRQSSIELLGDLLFKVAGTSGKVRLDDDEEEGISTEAHGEAIIQALGLARRNQILAKVYLARSDVGYSVRGAALHVWKTLVTNTPRTLAEILPFLMESIIQLLASDGEEQQQMAGACLGELVRKMGERVLRQIIPILQDGMRAAAPATRLGVCTGLRELLENISHAQLREHLPQLLPTVQSALVDADPDVRQAAGAAFAVLFRGGAGSAVDSVIPSMLAALTGGGKGAGQALEGLRVILGVRPQTLGTMLPKLLRPPLTPTATRALAALSQVAGPAIHPHLGAVLPPLLLEASSGGPGAEAAEEAVEQVCGAVGEEGVYLLLGQLEKALEDPARRLAAARAVQKFCEASRLDFQEHVPSLLTALVTLLAEDDEAVLKACLAALAAVTGSVPKEALASHCRTLADAVSTAREKQRRKRRPGELLVPGLCLPKAPAPLLPIYLQGVLQGSSAELRQLAAEGLGELVAAASAEVLRPFVVQITGPLIRIVGDRFPWEIKAAILATLGGLLAKSGPGLKPFVPQLQTTFLKCLPDQARQVRQTAAENLGRLSAMSARVDALATELTSQAQSAPAGQREAALTALAGLLEGSGPRLAPATRAAAGAALRGLLGSTGEDEELARRVAECLGQFCRHCEAADFSVTATAAALSAPSASGAGQRYATAMALAALARLAAARLEEAGLTARAVATAVSLARDESPATREAAARAAGHLALAEARGELPQGAALQPLVPTFVALLGADQVSDVQRQQLHVLRTLAVVKRPALEPHYGELVPSLCSLLSSGSGPTKLATERTLARVLQAAEGPEVAQAFLATSGPGMATARSILSETYLRRLSKLPLDDAEDASFT